MRWLRPWEAAVRANERNGKGGGDWCGHNARKKGDCWQRTPFDGRKKTLATEPSMGFRSNLSRAASFLRGWRKWYLNKSKYLENRSQKRTMRWTPTLMRTGILALCLYSCCRGSFSALGCATIFSWPGEDQGSSTDGAADRAQLSTARSCLHLVCHL